MDDKKFNRINVFFNSSFEIPLKIYCLKLGISISAFFQNQIKMFLENEPVLEKEIVKKDIKKTTIVLDKEIKTQLNIYCVKNEVGLIDVFNYIIYSVVFSNNS